MVTDVELVKMSGKGQLVVPQDIRDTLHLSPGERFVAFPVKDGVLFKKVKIQKIKLRFESLSKEVQEQFKRNKVKKGYVREAIRWARKR